MDLIQFIPENLIVLVVALYCLGGALKTTPAIKDWTIPYILMTLGVIGSSAISGLNATSIITGVIASFCSTGINQLVKQAIKQQ